MWYWGPTGGWGMPLLGAFMMLVVWGGVALLVVVLVRTLTTRAAPQDSALDTLRRRLAAGEITAEEYDRLRRVIQT